MATEAQRSQRKTDFEPANSCDKKLKNLMQFSNIILCVLCVSVAMNYLVQMKADAP